MSLAEGEELTGATATATPEAETTVGPGGLGEDSATTAQPAEGESSEALAGEEGAQPPVEDQPPAPLPEGWQEHPEAKDVFDTHFNNGRGQRERELRREMDRRDERSNTEVQDAYRQGAAAEVVQGIAEALKEGYDLADADGRAEIRKLMGAHREWAVLFDKDHLIATEAALVREVKTVVREVGLPEEVVGELSDFEHDLSWKVRHGEASLATGLKELMGETIKRVVTHAEAEGARKEGERRDKLEREMTGATGRAAERLGQSPPTAPGGAGAGSTPRRTPAEEKLDPRTPIPRLREIRQEEKAGRR